MGKNIHDRRHDEEIIRKLTRQTKELDELQKSSKQFITHSKNAIDIPTLPTPLKPMPVKPDNLEAALIEALPYPAMLIRRNRTVIFANRVARDAGAVIGGQCWKEFAQSDYIPEEDKPFVDDNDRPPGWTQCTFCLADEALDNFRPAIEPEINAFGRIWEIYWVPVNDDVFLHYAFDITERKLIQQQLDDLLKVLTAKNKELQSIVYIASHDLKNPLVNIAGFSGELGMDCRELKELIKSAVFEKDKASRVDNLINDSIPECLGFITAGINKMKMLLDGLLQVSRIGTAEVNLVSINMNEIVNQVIKENQFRSKEGHVNIIVDDLPDCFGDSVMVNQVFSNLMSNALKYLAPDRPGEIHVSGRTENRNSIYCVEDNGIGINPAHIKKIFDVFHRLNPDDSAGGEGLGLSIVLRTLDRLNGSIRVESQPDKGSKFFVILPVAK